MWLRARPSDPVEGPGVCSPRRRGPRALNELLTPAWEAPGVGAGSTAHRPEGPRQRGPGSTPQAPPPLLRTAVTGGSGGGQDQGHESQARDTPRRLQPPAPRSGRVLARLADCRDTASPRTPLAQPRSERQALNQSCEPVQRWGRAGAAPAPVPTPPAPPPAPLVGGSAAGRASWRPRGLEVLHQQGHPTGNDKQGIPESGGGGTCWQRSVLQTSPPGPQAPGSGGPPGAHGSAMHTRISVGTEPRVAAREAVPGTGMGREACEGGSAAPGPPGVAPGPVPPCPSLLPPLCRAHTHRELAGRLPGPEPLPL